MALAGPSEKSKSTFGCLSSTHARFSSQVHERPQAVLLLVEHFDTTLTPRPKPSTLNPKPSTLNPKPSTLTLIARCRGRGIPTPSAPKNHETRTALNPKTYRRCQ